MMPATTKSQTAVTRDRSAAAALTADPDLGEPLMAKALTSCPCYRGLGMPLIVSCVHPSIE